MPINLSIEYPAVKSENTRLKMRVEELEKYVIEFGSALIQIDLLSSRMTDDVSLAINGVTSKALKSFKNKIKKDETKK